MAEAESTEYEMKEDFLFGEGERDYVILGTLEIIELEMTNLIQQCYLYNFVFGTKRLF